MIKILAGFLGSSLGVYVLTGSLAVSGLGIYFWHKQGLADARQAAVAETRTTVLKEQEDARKAETARLEAIIEEKDALIADLARRRNTITERIIERERAAEEAKNEVDTKDLDRVIDDVVDWALRAEANRVRGRVETNRQSPDSGRTGRGESSGAGGTATDR